MTDRLKMVRTNDFYEIENYVLNSPLNFLKIPAKFSKKAGREMEFIFL